MEVHASEVDGFVSCLPVEEAPIAVGMDANTPFQWMEVEGGWEAVGREGKGDLLLNRYREIGVALTAPPKAQKSRPTCRPRKQDVCGRHIDVVGSKGACCVGLGIVEGSYLFIGSDHDIVLQRLDLVTSVRNRKRRPSTCPKKVTGPVAVPDMLNQNTLREMAQLSTRPYAKTEYTDPQHVKVYFQVARRSKLPEDWKRALRERAKARAEWKTERVKDATNGDWKAYRECSKKGAVGWETHLATELAEQGLDPHRAVHEHFSKLYAGPSLPSFPFPSVPRSPDFTSQELQCALSKGKNGKATGEDGVPHELLVVIGRSEEGEAALLAWFNRLLHGEERIPEDWGRAVMVLIPKCLLPQQAKQLRPICLGSSANKVFARMLLERSRAALQYSSSFQNMGAGRQTVDHIWTVARLMALEQEWRYGLTLLKLDICEVRETQFTNTWDAGGRLYG